MIVKLIKTMKILGYFLNREEDIIIQLNKKVIKVNIIIICCSINVIILGPIILIKKNHFKLKLEIEKF